MAALKFDHIEITMGEDIPDLQYKEKRDCYAELEDFMARRDLNFGRICALYGLRRTGKTDLMWQYIYDMPEEEKKETAYILCSNGADMLDVRRCMDALHNRGVKNFFLDEITLAEDFQASANILSDIYAKLYGKVVIAATDSLGIMLSRSDRLFDRVYMIHTSHVPYAEYARLLDEKSLDDYIAYGGLLTDEYYRDGKLREEYMNSSIVDNILHSLMDAGEHRRFFVSLASKFDHEELRSVINRMINKFSYNVVLKSLNKRFKSAPLTAVLRNPDADEYKSLVDVNLVNEKVKEAARILNPEEMKTTLEEADLENIKKYLETLDLLLRIPSRLSLKRRSAEEEIQILLQPGMIYAHATYLEIQLSEDESWVRKTFDEDRKQFIRRTGNFVRGEIMEGIILSETYLALQTAGLDPRYYVSQLSVHVNQRDIPYDGRDAEADLLVADHERKETYLFEVKYSEEYVERQSRHIRNADFISYVNENFYPVKHRAVIYRGCSGIDEDGIIFLNAEEYLKKVDVLRKKEQPEFSDTIFPDRELPHLKEEAEQEIGSLVTKPRVSTADNSMKPKR